MSEDQIADLLLDLALIATGGLLVELGLRRGLRARAQRRAVRALRKVEAAEPSPDPLPE